MNADESAPTGVAAPALRTPAPVELSQLAGRLVSGSKAEQLEAATLVHRFVSVAAALRELRIDNIVRSGIVAPLVEALRRTADVRPLADIVGAIAGIACSDFGCAACITAQAPAALVALAAQPAVQASTDAVKCVAASLTNIARTVNGLEACVAAHAPASIVVLAGLPAVMGSEDAAWSLAEALEVLSRSASGRAACIAAQAPAALIKFAALANFQTSSGAVSSLAHALSNIAANSYDGRAACASAGAPEALVSLARLPAVQDFASAADQVSMALANIAIGVNGISACITADAPAALVALARYQAADGETSALGNIDSALGCIASLRAGEAAVLAAVNNILLSTNDENALQMLCTLLISSRGILRKGACEALASILTNSHAEVQAVLDSGCVPLLVALAGKHWTEPQASACHALVFVVESGTREQIAFLVQHSVIDTFIEIVRAGVHNCSEKALRAISVILSAGADKAREDKLTSNAFLTEPVRVKLGLMLRRLARTLCVCCSSSPVFDLASSILTTHIPAPPCSLCLAQFEEASLPFPAGRGHDHGKASACAACLRRFVETGVADVLSGAAPASHLHRCWAWASGCGARVEASDLEAAGVLNAVVASFRSALADPERAAAVHRAAAANGDLRAVFSAAEVDELAALVRAEPDRWTVCPGCFARIERNGGCDHITHSCALGVTTDFCFCCGERSSNTRCPTPHRRLLGLITLEPTRAESEAESSADRRQRRLERMQLRNQGRLLLPQPLPHARLPHQEPQQPPQPPQPPL